MRSKWASTLAPCAPTTSVRPVRATPGSPWIISGRAAGRSTVVPRSPCARGVVGSAIPPEARWAAVIVRSRLLPTAEQANRAGCACRLVGRAAVPGRGQREADAARGRAYDVGGADEPWAAVNGRRTETDANPGRNTRFGARALETRTTARVSRIAEGDRRGDAHVVALSRRHAHAADAAVGESA
jgi:hypothetical protein